MTYIIFSRIAHVNFFALWRMEEKQKKKGVDKCFSVCYTILALKKCTFNIAE